MGVLERDKSGRLCLKKEYQSPSVQQAKDKAAGFYPTEAWLRGPAGAQGQIGMLGATGPLGIASTGIGNTELEAIRVGIMQANLGKG